MSEAFDPYLRWLGIRDPRRPPNHYRLLGVELFESDPDVLSHAADRQMAHVRTFQSGKHSAESQKLLNELARAKVCLLNPEKKAAYDAKLRAMEAAAGPPQLPPGFVSGTPPQVPPPLSAVAEQPPLPPPAVPPLPEPQPETPVFAAPRITTRAARERSRRVSLIIAIAVLIALVVALVTVAYTPSDRFRHLGQQLMDLLGAVSGGQNGAKPGPQAEPKPETRPEPLPKPQSEPEAQPPSKPARDSELAPAVGQVGSVPPDVSKPVEPKPAVPETSPPELPKEKLLAVPSAAAQAESLKEIRSVLRKEYSRATTPAQKRTLADTLLKKALETNDDPVARYVLLAEAREEAAEAGDAQLFLDALGQTAKQYHVDLTAAAAASLEKAARKPRLDPAAALAMAKLAVTMATQAGSGEEHEVAVALARTAIDLSRKSKDSVQVKHAGATMREIKFRQQLHQSFLATAKTLAAQPDDPQANLLQGQYYCFVKGDWPRGLPLLGKGDDAKLKELAEAELAEPADGRAPLALGDAWYQAAATAADEHVQRAMSARAVYWYQQALPALSGLTRTKIERRIEELGRGERN